MYPAATHDFESRQYPRLTLPPMYTLVRARLLGEERYRWTGHAYDVSRSGIRFELDEALAPGTELELRVMLPSGHDHPTFKATGRVVRIHDDEEDRLGPVRMGLTFGSFASSLDRQTLENYLGRFSHRLAA